MLLASVTIALTMPFASTPLATDAWNMFDATNASSLIACEGNAEVDFIGFNRTGFPYLQDDMITVWDNDNNHYLFTVTCR